MGGVLVTGGTGALGSHLVELLLERKIRVVTWGSTGRAAPAGAVEDTVDVRRPSEVGPALRALEPELVFHLAGTRVGSVRELTETNVLGFANLAAAAVQLPAPPWILVAGSSAQYGARGSLEPLSETAPLLATSWYGATKSAQEELALCGSRAGLFPAVAVRLFNLIGPRQEPGLLAADMARQLADAGCDRVVVRHLVGTRDLVDYRDAARALLALADAGASGEIFNVCTGRASTLRELAEGLVRAAGRDVPIVLEDPDSADEATAHQVGSHTKLTAATGWEPRIPLEQSMLDLVEWWRGRR